MIGRTVSHFRIVSQLGAGGMGVVYRADDLRLGRSVALKFLPEELAKDPHAIERLRVEARAASALNHTNICTIYDIDDVDGQPFIAMELMKGQTLRERLEGGALKIHQLVDIGIQIADALDAAHSQNIVHRDIKPANIFLTDRNHVKLLDFGLAKQMSRLSSPSTTAQRGHLVTGEGITLGTVSYMSPEQATGEELDGRTDLFSVGVVLYECATGHRPFSGKTTPAILAAIISRSPQPASSFNSEIPVRLQDVISNCLEKDRELRYQSAADLRADLKRVRRDLESGRSEAVRTASREEMRSSASSFRAGQTVPLHATERAAATAVVPEPPQPPAAPASRRSVGLLAIGAIALAILAGAAFFFASRQERTTAANPLAALSDATVRNRGEFAAQSFAARNYRAALAYASEVLAVAPDDAGAMRIRDESRAMIARFDIAIEEARQRSAAGDVAGAAQALERARAIDPTAPSVTELSARLSEQLKSQPGRPSERPRIAAASPPPRQAAAPAAPPPEPPPAASTPIAPTAQPVEPGVDRTTAQSAPAAPPVLPAPAPPPAAQPDTTASAPDAPVKPAEPAPAPAAPAAAAQPPAPAEDDDAAIRRLVASYGRAIETKDLGLFRAVKPNLSREEERRLTEGFRAVTSQRVELTILGIDRQGPSATVQVRRRDVIETGRQRQTTESRQTLALSRSSGGWIIVGIR
jgi:serine/threonine protein kinase